MNDLMILSQINGRKIEKICYKNQPFCLNIDFHIKSNLISYRKEGNKQSFRQCEFQFDTN